MAVSADDNQIKILANDHGRQFLQESAFISVDSLGCLTEFFRKVSYYLLGSICFAAETFHLNACPLSQLSVETVPFPCQATMGSCTAVSALSCRDLYCLHS